MSPSDVINLLCDLIPTGITVILRGSPGCAKSAVVGQAIAKMNRNMVTIYPAERDPIDFTGIPTVKDKFCTWTTPDWLPRTPNDVLFVDEMGQATKQMQTVCARLLHEHCAGGHKLPEGCAVVGATNRQDDRAGVNQILTQLANRAIWIDLEVSADDWQTWAASNGIDPIVRSYLRFQPDDMYKFDPKSDQLAYPTLRSWETTSKLITKVRENLIYSAVAGCIGEGTAAKFQAFRKTFLELPDPATILANPKGAKMPREASVLWATVGALTGLVKTASDQGLNAIATYAMRMQQESADVGGKECGICLVKDAWRINTRMKTLPETMKWLGMNRDVLLPD